MIHLNPDAEHVQRMREAILNNDGYCPCKTEKSPENKCMCQEFKEQEHGYCRCELYYK